MPLCPQHRRRCLKGYFIIVDQQDAQAGLVSHGRFAGWTARMAPGQGEDDAEAASARLHRVERQMTPHQFRELPADVQTKPQPARSLRPRRGESVENVGAKRGGNSGTTIDDFDDQLPFPPGPEKDLPASSM